MITNEIMSAQFWDGSKVLFVEDNGHVSYRPEQIIKLEFYGIQYLKAWFNEYMGYYNVNGDRYFGGKLQCLKKILNYIDRIDLSTCRWKYGTHNNKYCQAYVFGDKCLGCVYADLTYKLCNGTEGKFESWKEGVDGIQPLLDTLHEQIRNIIAEQREQLCGMIKEMEDMNISTD